MNLLFLVLLGFLSCLISPCLYSQGRGVDKATSEVFPQEITFESGGKQYQLDMTGVSTRRKLVVKIYNIAHYLQKGIKGDKMQAILSDEYAKQFTINWVHNVSLDKVHNAYQESFHRVFTKEQYDKMQKEIHAFLSLFSKDAHKGDQYIIRWVPGGHTEVVINGKLAGEVQGQEFVKGLWNVWFGQKSIVDVNELLSK